MFNSMCRVLMHQCGQGFNTEIVMPEVDCIVLDVNEQRFSLFLHTSLTFYRGQTFWIFPLQDLSSIVVFSLLCRSANGDDVVHPSQSCFGYIMCSVHRSCDGKLCPEFVSESNPEGGDYDSANAEAS